MFARAGWLGLCLILCSTPVYADRLAFGTFRSIQNAENWAQKLTQTLAQPIAVTSVATQEGTLHRVASAPLSQEDYAALRRRADRAGIQYWRLVEANKEPVVAGEQQTPTPSKAETSTAVKTVQPAVAPQLGGTRVTPPNKITTLPTSKRSDAAKIEWELGLQSRTFGASGLMGQGQWEGSASAQGTYYRGWNGDTRSVTFTPFVRLDSNDSERTHADVRELFYSQVGENWDVHIGAKRVFWGVTEFHHLIDIINQTDLVENIDGEDKLGQPMVHLSLLRDWGILEFFALTGARTRTFPGEDGRLRLPFRIRGDAEFESGAQELRVDGAARWSHYMGPFEIGLHHFSGTSREPLLRPQFSSTGQIVLEQYYPVIDQTGIDAQAFVNEWVFKLEGFNRSGFDDRYAAFNVGFERTLVGLWGSQADLGIVGEYFFDERGEDAFNTFFENDIALGGRLALNDFADTKALLGVIVDADTQDYIVSLEGSRRLSQNWLLSIEGRLFAGGERLSSNDLLPVLLDPDFKTAVVQRDDYLQIEFKKFF